MWLCTRKPQLKREISNWEINENIVQTVLDVTSLMFFHNGSYFLSIISSINFIKVLLYKDCVNCPCIQLDKNDSFLYRMVEDYRRVKYLCHHCFKKWLGAKLSPIHFLKQSPFNRLLPKEQTSDLYFSIWIHFHWNKKNEIVWSFQSKGCSHLRGQTVESVRNRSH